ncbi:MAG: cytochrome d ubiquinol oxidase subunit II [Thermoanaerobaculia bacterium]
MDLQTTWFFVVGVLFAGYSVLDGIDGGVGTLVLARAGDDETRRRRLGTLGPATFGNEFWLVAGFAALFAAFPPVRAAVTSAFGGLLALLALVLVMRAGVLGKGRTAEVVDRSRDVAFGALSVVATFLLGLMLGNVLLGLPLDEAGRHAGSFGGLLSPFAIVVAAETVALFALQGACWLRFRAGEDEDVVLRAWVTAVALHGLTGVSSLFAAPHLWEPYHHPLTWIAPAVMLSSLVALPYFVKAGRPASALAASSLSIAALWGIVGQGLHPALVPARGSSGESLTIATAAASPDVLTSLLVVLLLALTLVAGYSAFVFLRFRRSAA